MPKSDKWRQTETFYMSALRNPLQIHLSSSFFNLNDSMLAVQLCIKSNNTNWRATRHKWDFPPESFWKNDNMRRDLPEIIAAQSWLWGDFQTSLSVSVFHLFHHAQTDTRLSSFFSYFKPDVQYFYFLNFSAISISFWKIADKMENVLI